MQLDQNGVARVYDLHVAASDAGTTPVPLVLYLHPLLTNKDPTRSPVGLCATAARERRPRPIATER